MRGSFAVFLVVCVAILLTSTQHVMVLQIQLLLPNFVDGVKNTTTPLFVIPPGTSKVILNIGSNVDPILPNANDGPCAKTIAFEPLAHDGIDPHPQLIVVPVAVSYQSGVATLYDYGINGVSSSLAPAMRQAKWNFGLNGEKGGGQQVQVPLITLQTVLETIGDEIPIDFIMTDMQGHDFETVSSAIDMLLARNVTRLRTEVALDRSITYRGVKNDLCLHWMPFMESHGYRYDGMSVERVGFANASDVRVTCEKQRNDFYGIFNQTFRPRLKEADVYWRHESLPENQNYLYDVNVPKSAPIKQYNKSLHLLTRFTAEDYATCTRRS